MNAWIYTGNHDRGIEEDYLVFLRDDLEFMGYQVSIGERPSGATSVIIWVDAFDSEQIAELTRQREAEPNAAFVLMATEWPTKFLNLFNTFNWFGGNSKFQLFIYCLPFGTLIGHIGKGTYRLGQSTYVASKSIHHFTHSKLKNARTTLGQLKIPKPALKKIYGPSVHFLYETFGDDFKASVRRVVRRNQQHQNSPETENSENHSHLPEGTSRSDIDQLSKEESGSQSFYELGRHIYNRDRFKGFRKALKSFDLVLLSHPAIGPKLNSFNLAKNSSKYLPSVSLDVFEEMFHRNINSLGESVWSIEITGTMSDFRLEWVTKINEWLAKRNGKIKSVSGKGFQYGMTDPRELFALHPPQTEEWEYSSPTRIWRSLRLGQIPLLTRRFGDHPIEEIAIDLSDLKDLEALEELIQMSPSTILEKMTSRISKYNEATDTINQSIRHQLDSISTRKNPSLKERQPSPPTS